MENPFSALEQGIFSVRPLLQHGWCEILPPRYDQDDAPALPLVQSFHGNAHLLRDDDQGVLVLGQEVEDAPDLEGVVIGDDQPAQIQVLLGAQRPAHLVEVLTIKVVGHLRQNQNRLFLQAADQSQLYCFKRLH